MNVKKIVFKEAAQQRLLKGAAILARNVAVAYGPHGRHIAIEMSDTQPLTTRCGITIAETIELMDPAEDAGAALIIQAARKTHENAGDGASITILLAEAMLRHAIKYTWTGTDPVNLRQGLLHAIATMCRELDRLTTPCLDEKTITQVATVAANGDEALGSLIAQALIKTGRDGAVVLEEGDGLADELRFIEGLQFDGRCLDPQFLDEKGRLELDRPYIALADTVISTPASLSSLLNAISLFSRPLLIVADMEKPVLGALLAHRRGVKLAVIKPPASGEQRRLLLEDIAVMTGGCVLADYTGRSIEKAGLNELGTARTIRITRVNTTLMGGGGAKRAIEARIVGLRQEIDHAPAPSIQHDDLCRRLSGLSGGVAVIRLGAATQFEMRERKERAESALAAARAARNEGVLPGGGVGLLRACNAIRDLRDDDPGRMAGIQVVLRAVEEPLRRIVENAGGAPQVVVNRVAQDRNLNFGYNAVTGTFGDMMEMGILNPARTIRSALENAASAACLMIMTGSVITDAHPAPG